MDRDERQVHVAYRDYPLPHPLPHPVPLHPRARRLLRYQESGVPVG